MGGKLSKGVNSVKKLWLIALLLVFAVSGCAYTEMMTTIRRGYEENKEKTEEVVAEADKALVRLGELIDDAANDKVPDIASDDRSDVAEAASDITETVAPFLPTPWNGIVTALAGLIPGIGAWIKANSARKKRELEEVLLIKALNELKHTEPEMFAQFLKYRDKIAQGMLTAKQVIALLNGIESIKTKYT